MRRGWLVLMFMTLGCGTTRTTDTQRAASEMLLVSQAVDHAVSQLDCSALAGRTAFLDTQYLDGTVDKGYVISSLRQHLLAYGAYLIDDRTKAQYVVEPRSGGVGTDRNGLLVGTPAMSLPALLPGVPTSIPEVALIKKTDQKGIAKLAVFAYNRQTGRPLWQSGLVEGTSTIKDKWYFGAGPYTTGTIKPDGEFAGERLPHLPLPFVTSKDRDKDDETPAVPAITTVKEPYIYTNPDAPPGPAVPVGFLGLVGGLAGDRPIIPSNPPKPLPVSVPGSLSGAGS